MISGVDEAGRGPILGPLIIAGITLKDDTSLIELKVRDSKKCTPKRREHLAQKIKEIADNYELMIIPAADIDDMRKTMTMNELEVHAFSKIIERLHPDVCYVDAADVNEVRFGETILARLSFKPIMVSKHKADAIYPIVSAASILAKTTRDDHVRRIEKELQKKLNLPLGSGYPADRVTQQFLKTWINTFGEMPPYVRHSWKTAQNLEKEYKTKKLDDF